jgi:hypothetical protein
MNKLASVFMIVTLLWLTVSTPFINTAQQQKVIVKSAPVDQSPADSDDSSNPFGNTTEEKNPVSSSFSEEFLHEHHAITHWPVEKLSHDKCTHPALYIAFHGELLSPPPEA